MNLHKATRHPHQALVDNLNNRWVGDGYEWRWDPTDPDAIFWRIARYNGPNGFEHWQREELAYYYRLTKLPKPTGSS